MSIFRDALWAVTVLLQTLWAIRLWRFSLTHRYPILFIYLCSLTLLAVVSYSLFTTKVHIFGHPAYTWFWIVTRPFVWILLFLLVLEVYNHMLEEYRGLRRLGRVVFYGAVGSVAVVIFLLAYSGSAVADSLPRWMGFWLTLERDIYLSVAGVVFLLLLFKKLFHLALPRNVELIFASFGLYFAGTAAFTVLRAYLGSWFLSFTDTANFLLYAFCLGIGAMLFSRMGEAKPRRSLAVDECNAAAKLASRQLESLNRRLGEVLG